MSKPCLRMRCEFCKGHHHFASCDVYKTAAERKARLRHLEKCLHCINQSLPCKCNPNKPCRYCEERHHFAFCPRKFGRLEQGTRKLIFTLILIESSGELVDISGGSLPEGSCRKREYVPPSQVPNASSGVRHPVTTTPLDY